MADRRREDRNRSEERESIRVLSGDADLGNILLGLGGLALAGGALYAAARAFSGGDEEVPQRSSISSPNSRHNQNRSLEISSHGLRTESFHHFQRDSRQSEDYGITIAVDATPDRAGGLLVLPGRQQVYLYSINWSGRFSFVNEPDKFEMVNSLLALCIFEEYIERYRRGASVLLKTDSNFCISPATVYAGQKNADWRNLFRTIDKKLKDEPFEGQWHYCSKSSDVYIRIADKLSRIDHSQSSTFPQIGESIPFSSYSIENVSEEKRHLLYKIENLIPKKGF